jgi:hypothetical protein
VGSGGGGTSVGSGGTSVGSGGTSVGCTGAGASVVEPPHAVINIANTTKVVSANHPNLFFEFIFSSDQELLFMIKRYRFQDQMYRLPPPFVIRSFIFSSNLHIG